MICDRAAAALTCEAVEFTGLNVDELRALVGADQIRWLFDTWCLVSPDGSSTTCLEVGDYVVKGVDEDDWDFYRIKPKKFPRIWTPRPTGASPSRTESPQP